MRRKSRQLIPLTAVASVCDRLMGLTLFPVLTATCMLPEDRGFQQIPKA